jgi:hypothetical protein
VPRLLALQRRQYVVPQRSKRDLPIQALAALPFLRARRLSTIPCMGIRRVRLAKPLYAAMPYAYISAGLLTVIGAYHLLGTFWADVALVLGVFCVVGGVVVLLMRRDARERRSEYTGGNLDENKL